VTSRNSKLFDDDSEAAQRALASSWSRNLKEVNLYFELATMV